MSNEYAGAIALVIVGLLQVFGVVVERDAIVGIVTGAIALFVAYKRYQKGDIDVLGRRI